MEIKFRVLDCILNASDDLVWVDLEAGIDYIFIWQAALIFGLVFLNLLEIYKHFF